MRQPGTPNTEHALYYLHHSPLTQDERGALNGKFEYEWSELVAVSREAFAARMRGVQEKIEERGMQAHVEGPLIIEDEKAEAKSRHDVWRMRIPQAEIVDVQHLTQRSVGTLVGPIAEEQTESKSGAETVQQMPKRAMQKPVGVQVITGERCA
jgi:hypothetical protein